MLPEEVSTEAFKRLPPELLLLQIAVAESEEEAKPIVATVRSYSLSSAKGVRFMKALQDHLEACVDVVKKTMHEQLELYLAQAQSNPRQVVESSESQHEILPRNNFRVPPKKPNEITKLANLDELNAQVVSVPKGNLHNKAYSYRMLTYSVRHDGVDFKVGEADVKVFVGRRPPGAAPRRRLPRWLDAVIQWGKKPFIANPTLTE